MAQKVQSIEDLIAGSKNGHVINDESAQAKFQSKQKQIKIKEMERKTEGKAADLGVSYINLFGFPISPEALSMIKEYDAEKIKVVCFFYDGKKIRLGAINSQSNIITDMLQKLCTEFYCDGEIYLISQNSFDYTMELYKSLPKIREISRGIELTEADLNKFSEKFSSFKDLQSEIDKAKITDIVTMIMSASIKLDSSDVHIEAEEEVIKVRFRVDGVLHDAATVNKELWKKIISV